MVKVKEKQNQQKLLPMVQKKLAVVSKLKYLIQKTVMKKATLIGGTQTVIAMVLILLVRLNKEAITVVSHLLLKLQKPEKVVKRRSPRKYVTGGTTKKVAL